MVCKNTLAADGSCVLPTTCVDNDHDGAGDGCPIPDCDDGNAAIHPGAVAIEGNGVDEDCAIAFGSAARRRVSVTVFSTKKLPLPNSVVAFNRADGSLIGTATTDADGRAWRDDLPPGASLTVNNAAPVDDSAHLVTITALEPGDNLVVGTLSSGAFGGGDMGDFNAPAWQAVPTGALTFTNFAPSGRVYVSTRGARAVLVIAKVSRKAQSLLAARQLQRAHSGTTRRTREPTRACSRRRSRALAPAPLARLLRRNRGR